MKEPIDLALWKRREHFTFFSGMDDPFWGLTTTVDATVRYKRCRHSGTSFFLSSLHAILQAVNEVEEFRYRIEEGMPVCYDRIHASPTVARADETFGFSFMPYVESLEDFLLLATEEVQRVQAASGLCLDEQAARADVIHFSTLPWISFTDLKHAGSLRTTYADSVPKISTGKLKADGHAMLLPISVTVHHGLVDGLHVGRFLERLQYILNT